MTDIDYCGRNQTQETSADEGIVFRGFFSFLAKNSGGSVLHAKKKGKSVYFDAIKLKTENKTPHLNHMDIVWYLFLSEKKEKKKKNTF